MTLKIQSYQSKTQQNQKTLISLTNLIIQQQNPFKESDIQKLFQVKKLPLFFIQDIKKNALLKKYNSFPALLNVLDKWNQKVSRQQISSTCRSQLFRNQFIFSSLKSIIVQSANVQQSLQQLYNWYHQNSDEKEELIFSPKKKSAQYDQDWIIRKNYKSNMPVELLSYRRREIISKKKNSFQDIKFLSSTPKEVSYKQITSNTISSWAQYKYYQEQLRKKRQQQQVHALTSKWKKSKSRFQQKNLKNQYKHQFDSNGIFFQLKKKNSSQISLVTERNETIDKVKLVRLRKKIFGPRIETKQIQRINEQKQIFSPLTIDGVRLVSNPFELLTNKKRKRKMK